MNEEPVYDQEVAMALRGKEFMNAEPLCNAEVMDLLKTRADTLGAARITVPSMIRDTLKDLSKVAKVTNATVDLSVIQKQKTNLESIECDGDGKTLRLDPVEVCQILNLAPEDEDELKSYMPTLKRFEDYQLSLLPDALK
ncbi:hypothetical protein WA556_001103 [Blastocystis sp. ATCC 50177/Nand II]